MDNSGNKRIALNTIFMYVRLFTTMFIGLYTSRVVLLVLGVSDYGLFSVVGGVLAMFTFISGSLGAATTRFLNVEMGKTDGDVNRSFNLNLTLHIVLAAIIFILAETVGLWYVCTRLNVESNKLGDAIFVYQISIVTACLGIINAPYSCLFSAFERFKFLAQFDIINNFIRLGLVILMQYYSGNSLRFYSVIMCLTTVNTFVIYHWISARDWPEIIKLKFVRGWQNYKEVLGFTNWNIFATMALMARSTGCDLVINLFFGTAVNGAFSVSKTINNYITTFSTNFDSASGPQIIQSYSSGDMQRCNYLVNKLGRFCILLFEFVFFPLYVELDFILHLWLKEVPDGVLIFCQLNLILAAVALTCGGLVQVVNASGKIKWFKLSAGILFILCVPFCILIYKIGAPSYSMLILFIIADIFSRIIQLILLKKIIGFDSWRYVREAYTKPFLIAVIMIVFLVFVWQFEVVTPWIKLCIIFSTFGTTSILIYKLGLTKGEQTKILNFAKSTLNLG